MVSPVEIAIFIAWDTARATPQQAKISQSTFKGEMVLHFTQQFEDLINKDKRKLKDNVKHTGEINI